MLAIACAEFENMIETDRNQKRDLRLFGMITDEVQCLISRHVKRFDSVFSIDLLSSNPRLLVSNTDPPDVPGEH